MKARASALIVLAGLYAFVIAGCARVVAVSP